MRTEKLHNLHPSPNVIRAIKSRRMRLVGNIACMDEMINSYIIVVGKTGGKNLGVYERII
jgi:hypothetical protein